MSESAETPVATPSEARPAASSDASGLLEGSLIGGYRVLETVDTGPEATLYRVEPVAGSEGRLRGLAEQGVIALGSIPRGRIDPDRFAEAARRLAGIEASALARPLHGGVTSDRRVWVLYGDPPGEPLDAYCDRLRLGVEPRVRWLVEVLGALTSAHSQLVLHGFLAPELVRVVEAPEGDEDGARVVVFGFGLHSLAGAGQAIDGPALLAAGMPLTPLASPEELLGEPLSVASDVYRVGLLLLRLVFGPRPSTEGAEADAELEAEPEAEPQQRVRAMVERATIDPWDRFEALDETEQAAVADARSTTPVALAEMLRGDLGQVLASALAEEPGERPASADALADRLRRWGSERTSTEDPAPRSDRPRRTGRRLAVALVVLLLGVFAWRGWELWRDTAQRGERFRVAARVERALTDAFGLADSSMGVAGPLPPELARELEGAGPEVTVEALGRLGEIAAGRGEETAALAWHDLARERAVAAFGEGSLENALSLLRGARSAGALRSTEAAERSRRAYRTVQTLGARHPAEELEAELLLANAVADAEPERALELAGRALSRLARADDQGLPEWLSRGLGIGGGLPPELDRDRARLEARLARSRALLASGRLDEARQELDRADDEPALAVSGQLAADLWSARALLLERSGGSTEERVASLERELEARTRIDGERAASTLEAAQRLAEALAADGRLEGAIARSLQTAELADDSTRRARAWERAGRWQIDAGRPLEAVDSFELALGEATPGSEDEAVLAVLAATAELRAGRAEAALERVDRVSGAGSGGRNPFLQAARARALAAIGRSDAGVALREALDALRLVEADDSLAAAPLLVALGEQLTAEGEAIVAEAYLRRALTILEGAEAAGHLVAEAESALGEGLLAQGRVEEGGELVRRAAVALSARDDEPARRAQSRVGLLQGEGS